MGILQKYQSNPLDIITIIPNDNNYFDNIEMALLKYTSSIDLFKSMVLSSSSSGEVLDKIRQKSINSQQRMALLKIFRRCVCSSLDTEASKKITKIPTSELIRIFGHLFIDINILKQHFSNITNADYLALSSLLAEYDKRGESGYQLTSIFFDSLNSLYPNYKIIGPEGAGRDVELNAVYPNFEGGNFPCDFVVFDQKSAIKTVGFCRYDSTRGGAQSDDRTGGNSQKVSMVINHFLKTNEVIKILFVSDGPGLSHRDTWEETLLLDNSWEDNVRVTTLKTLHEVTLNWL